MVANLNQAVDLVLGFRQRIMQSLDQVTAQLAARPAVGQSEHWLHFVQSHPKVPQPLREAENKDMASSVVAVAVLLARRSR